MEGDSFGILRAGEREERGRILIREKKTKATSSIKPAEEGKVSERREEKTLPVRGGGEKGKTESSISDPGPWDHDPDDQKESKRYKMMTMKMSLVQISVQLRSI